MSVSEFPQLLLKWYQKNARFLPWRSNPDPYSVWVSEIMLQQTRVETVIPYYIRWMERFPTIEDLGRATQQEVLMAWEGLGYYRRARNMQRTAQIVLQAGDTQLPRDPNKLAQLLGIGRSTAGAIASIAYNLNTPALDGNIRRVLARLFDVDIPARSPAGEKRLWQLAGEHLPDGKAGEYNQALMDLGSLICTPRNPDCAHCPLQELCLAKKRGLQHVRPVRLSRTAIPHHIVTAAIITRPPEILIAQRLETGLLGGLWEFPGGKQIPGEELEACLKREISEELDTEIEVGVKLGVYRHAYTHFRITLHAFHCKLRKGSQPRPVQVQDLRWVDLSELASYPMGKTDRQIAQDLMKQKLPC